MKALNLIRFFTLSVGVLGMTIIFSAVHAQEVDDLYFTPSDRKIKVVDVPNHNANTSSIKSKNITKTTQEYSSKNINPEYIARYKSTEANEVADPTLKENKEYSSKDYFVENYDNKEYVSDPNRSEIDYAALNKRDQMSTSNYNSYSNYNRPYSSPSWRFSPYMSMGYGSPYGYSPYMRGYDPYMMGYGSGMSMGMGFGSGFGYGSAMSYSLSMSWGTGYNPWGGWGGYPGYYSPYGRGGFHDPWGSSFGYNPYRSGGYGSSYGNYCYGGFSPTVLATASSSGSEYVNGRNVSYKSRTTRSTATPQYTRTSASADKVRVSSSSDRVRRPVRTISTSDAVSNGRTSSRNLSGSLNEKVQNSRYYNTARRSSASTSSSQRISNTYKRNTAGSSSRYNTSTITNNKPSRSSGYTSGYNRSATNTKSTSFTGRSRSSSGSSYSPSRSSGSSYSGRSSYSSGGSSSRSSSSYSSGGSSGGGSRSSGASRSGGRQ